MHAFGEELRDDIVKMEFTNDLEQRQQDVIASINPSTYPTAFPFARLPDELQRRILEFTGLVLPCWRITNQSYEPYQPQGLLVWHGQFNVPRRLTCCPECLLSKRMQWCETTAAQMNGCLPSLAEKCVWFELPTSLLYVSRKLSSMAQEVLLSSNRLVLRLGHSPRATLEFLQSQSAGGLLYLVKSLEFSFLLGFERTSAEHNSQVREEWLELVDFVSKNFQISNLRLSLEASGMHCLVNSNLDGTLNPDDSAQCALLWRRMKGFYDLIVSPFASDGGPGVKAPWAELKSFHVCFPFWVDLEPAYEKKVKGPAYDSYKTGKLPIARRPKGSSEDGAKRFHNLPHGWEWSDQEDMRWLMEWEPLYVDDVQAHPTMLEVMEL